MTDRGREFIGNEFTRLLKDWYRPTEGLAPAEVQVHGGDACLAKYKLLANHLSLLGNDDSSKPVPGYDPGHIFGNGDQEPHRNLPSTPVSKNSPPPIKVGSFTEHKAEEILGHKIRYKKPHFLIKQKEYTSKENT
ncbi:hypothetical protein DSO57_1029507 [Entomophthora muscae]|uniref:Uncharacterized protein n=1 Tax=Entomophthora muscae TaxID=34485 RepID=A0ACC2S3B1_9FUNG|nr:hypothetical protein DSO57_1029507 [Entomophthora muscae]